MKRKVLVLNQDNSPISICSVQRAFILTFLKKTEMVVPANGYRLRTVDDSFPMPAVIRLTRYVHIPYKGVALTRQNVFKRDNFNCQYCGISRDLTLDHVIPKSKGGRSSWDNLITACRRCNTRKGDFTPDQAGIRLKTKPFKPSYLMFLREFSGYHCDEWMPYLPVKIR
jgi:5-methylcytosine-specific restriction endonuclease McrA